MNFSARSYCSIEPIARSRDLGVFEEGVQSVFILFFFWCAIANLGKF
ncbi:hypothetical protein IQ249_15090 [Lusitaniella coriacea LEGE 07157]|uniref:Uncharacterized protein n=1 Tax=Lusitaniella coriacea LEGE 07157 TaxID=945747 RepID=A0A8J7E0S7_9CYAN|nr:hypothetical protein [Lusitaniella coriacea]MBE9117224.1 hypothetical protein [Lusitaniella coriacea LEGE 07157]